MKINRADSNELKSIPLFIAWQIFGGLYVCDTLFFEDVLYPAKNIKAVTYTVDAEILQYLKCKELLYAYVKNGPLPKNIKAKAISNIHTKMYIINDCDVWIGSTNLVIPGNLHNCMTQLSMSQAKSAKLYYKRLWSLAK